MSTLAKKGSGMSVTKQHSTRKKREAKSSVPSSFDSEMIYSFRTYPVNTAFVDKIINKLPIWFKENPNAKFITEFAHSVGLTYDDYHKLFIKHPRLKQEHETMKRMLGERMYSNAVDGKANWPAVKHRLWSYSPEFRQDEEFHSQLKANEKGNTDTPQVQYVVLESKFDTDEKVKEIDVEV